MVVLTQGCDCGAAFTLGFAAPRFQRWIDAHALRSRNFESHFRLYPRQCLAFKISNSDIRYYRLGVTGELLHHSKSIEQALK
jgi:hypothetical protein